MCQKNHYLLLSIVIIATYVLVSIVLAGETDTTLFIQAKASLDAIQYQQALEQFQAFISQNPASADVPEAMYYVGKCQYHLKNYNQATAVFVQFLTSYPYLIKTFANTYRLLGYSYSKLNQDNLAIVSFEKFIEANPKSPYCKDALLRIANIMVRNPATYSLEDQIATYQKIIDLYPNSTEAKEAEQRIAGLNERTSRGVSLAIQDYNSVYISAWRKIEKGKRSEAITEFNKIINDSTATSLAKAHAQLQKAGLLIEIAKGEDVSTPISDITTRDAILVQARQECKKVKDYCNDKTVAESDIPSIANKMYYETYWLQRTLSEDCIINFISQELTQASSLTNFGLVLETFVPFFQNLERHLEAIRILEKVILQQKNNPYIIVCEVKLLTLYRNVGAMEQVNNLVEEMTKKYIDNPIYQNNTEFKNIIVELKNQILYLKKSQQTG
ncbi:MAG: tetratricopeptide repeat protein [bacterium]|nr:tetratricopeptide repeat protein [bacterium]